MGMRGSATRPLALTSRAAVALALAGLFLAGLAALAPVRAGAEQPQATCFWIGPFDQTTLDRPDVNFAYPDAGVGYWAARFNLPEGAHLELEGRYPRSRYMSLNAYRSGTPIDALTDVGIRPDRGSVNPFVEGRRRDLGNDRRGWTAKVVNDPAPASAADREENTLYAPPEAGIQELIYRVYVPDRGRDSRGGVSLPKPVVVLEDGTRVTGGAACPLINNPVREITPQTVGVPGYTALVRTYGADRETVPAFNPVHWENFFNMPLALSIYKRGTPYEADRDAISREQVGGQYSNEDTRYITTSINRLYGKVLVIRGRMPTFPATEGRRRIRMGKGQVRYWSLCQNQSPVTTSVVSCLRDSQVPLTRKRQYTIVVSRKADRPKKARRSCGVAWLDWGRYVDPLGRGGTGLLIMRNLLATPTFRHAIQRITALGTEAGVMGRYFPRASYTGKGAFKGPRCKTRARPKHKPRQGQKKQRR